MEGHVHRPFALAVAVVMLHGGVASADKLDVNVSSDDPGVTVHAILSDLAAGGGGGGGSGCAWRVQRHTNSPVGGGTTEYEILGERPSPRHEALFVFCGDSFRTVIWLDPGAERSPPRRIAQELVEHIPVPFSGLGINPGTGLAGVESWFWVEGYDGTPITRTVDAFGLAIEVEAVPSRVRWDFGDGSPPVSAGLGHAYPARSSVRHVYTRSSGGTAYTVRLDIAFGVRYRSGGGPWLALPSISRSAARPYLVQQLQAVLR